MFEGDPEVTGQGVEALAEADVRVEVAALLVAYGQQVRDGERHRIGEQCRRLCALPLCEQREQTLDGLSR
ncbi:hypothetical protein [Streptomyces xanthophaeus]|uniref:hypothetical protein n=1 Tax=Streptomyces xanthophaeus TaxID=67385 RepID=UPI00371DA2C5